MLLGFFSALSVEAGGCNQHHKTATATTGRPIGSFNDRPGHDIAACDVAPAFTTKDTPQRLDRSTYYVQASCHIWPLGILQASAA